MFHRKRSSLISLRVIIWLMIGWLCLAPVLRASEPAEPGANKSLKLTVSAPTAMPGRNSPVSGGFPFPRGELSVSDGIRLRAIYMTDCFDEGGRYIPALDQAPSASLEGPTPRGMIDDVAYEDAGTEFGLSVDAATGASQMRVFDGQVTLRRRGGCVD